MKKNIKFSYELIIAHIFWSKERNKKYIKVKTMIDYNSINIKTENVLNINTEKYYREAEDKFFYFNSPKSALSLLDKGLKLTPHHIKSLKFKGDIYWAMGKVQKAFDNYSKAAALNPSDTTIMAAIAICLEALENYETALSFTEYSISMLGTDDYLIRNELFRLKATLLIKLRRFNEAEHFIAQIKNMLNGVEAEVLSNSFKKILDKKLELKNKIVELNMKIV